MIRTAYVNKNTILKFVETAKTDAELSAIAVLADVGMTACDTKQEFAVVAKLIPPQLFFGVIESRGRGVVLHARLEELPATPTPGEGAN